MQPILLRIMSTPYFNCFSNETIKSLTYSKFRDFGNGYYKVNIYDGTTSEIQKKIIIKGPKSKISSCTNNWRINIHQFEREDEKFYKRMRKIEQHIITKVVSKLRLFEDYKRILDSKKNTSSLFNAPIVLPKKKKDPDISPKEISAKKKKKDSDISPKEVSTKKKKNTCVKKTIEQKLESAIEGLQNAWDADFSANLKFDEDDGLHVAELKIRKPELLILVDEENNIVNRKQIKEGFSIIPLFELSEVQINENSISVNWILLHAIVSDYFSMQRSKPSLSAMLHQSHSLVSRPVSSIPSIPTGPPPPPDIKGPKLPSFKVSAADLKVGLSKLKKTSPKE
jgi:hypothetical protein